MMSLSTPQPTERPKSNVRIESPNEPGRWSIHSHHLSGSTKRLSMWCPGIPFGARWYFEIEETTKFRTAYNRSRPPLAATASSHSWFARKLPPPCGSSSVVRISIGELSASAPANSATVISEVNLMAFTKSLKLFSPLALFPRFGSHVDCWRTLKDAFIVIHVELVCCVILFIASPSHAVRHLGGLYHVITRGWVTRGVRPSILRFCFDTFAADR